MAEMHHLAGCWVITVEAGGIGADPQPPGAVFGESADEVARQRVAGFGARMVAEVYEFGTVPAIEAVLGAQPDETMAILVDRHHHTLGKSLLGAEVTKTQGTGLGFGHGGNQCGQSKANGQSRHPPKRLFDRSPPLHDGGMVAGWIAKKNDAGRTRRRSSAWMSGPRTSPISLKRDGKGGAFYSSGTQGLISAGIGLQPARGPVRPT